MPRVRLNEDANIKHRREALFARYGGYMTVASVMKELGVTRPTAMKFLSDLPAYSPTGKKVFSIEDVATKIERSRSPSMRESYGG